MNLFNYIHILIRRSWIIVLAVAITAGSAFAFSQLQTPIYRSSQQVLVQPARNDFGLVETLRILLRSYVEYLNTDQIAQEVINELQLDMTPGDLRSNVTINSDPTTLIVQIDVDLEDGAQASEIANAWGRQLELYRSQQNSDLRREDRIEAQVLDYPNPGQTSPNTLVNVLAGTVLGVLVGGIVIFVLEYLESNILRTSDDLERWIETPILAAIPVE